MAEDLLLLTLSVRGGQRRAGPLLDHALRAAEFVELTALGHTDFAIVDGPLRIRLHDGPPPSDDILAAALRTMARQRHPLSPVAWFSVPQAQRGYLRRMAARDLVTPVTSYRVENQPPSHLLPEGRRKAAEARKRVDRVLRGGGDEVDLLLACLLQEVGVARHLYGGPFAYRRRRRLAAMTENNRMAVMLRRSRRAGRDVPTMFDNSKEWSGVQYLAGSLPSR